MTDRWLAIILPAVVGFSLAASLIVLADHPTSAVGAAVRTARPELLILFGMPALLSVCAVLLNGLWVRRSFRHCLAIAVATLAAWCLLMGAWGWWRIGFWETAVVFFYLSFASPLVLLATLIGGSIGYLGQRCHR